jgi:hypothetical protein
LQTSTHWWPPCPPSICLRLSPLPPLYGQTSSHMTYCFILKLTLENCIKETKIAMKWFLNSQLCVNKKKTEVCVFH